MNLAICEFHAEFHAEFHWEVGKFVTSEGRAIWCSCFGSITTTEFKQSEKISSIKQCSFYDV